MNTFTTIGAIRAGWEIFKKRPGFFIGVWVLTIVLSWIVSAALRGHGGSFLGLVLFLVSFALSMLIDLGVTALSLKAYENAEAVQLADLWHPANYWQFLVANVVVGLGVVLGLILLIVPGVILGLMLMFSKYIVVTRGKSPIEAMRESARITSGHKWDILVFVLALIGLNILGAICLLVGLLVTLPVTSFAVVAVYRVLEQQASEPMIA